MVEKIVGLPAVEGLLFTFSDITHSPEIPKMNERFTVKGKVALFRLPFFGPIWIIATAVYPETWWEEIIPIIGSPEVRADATAIGSDFEITFPKGFSREGEFPLTLRAYAGPTMPLNSVTLPPFPPVASAEMTFTVSGEAPPEEEHFQNFRVKAYGKGSAEPVTPPGVLELERGDTCRIYLEMSHKGPAVSGEFYSSIGDVKAIFGFDEILVGRGDFTIPSSDDWESYEAHVDIPITAAISPGSYDLYAKIREITGGDVISPTLDDVITIKGVPEEGEITNLKIESYDSPVVIGGVCKVRVSFDYLGPAVSKRLYAAIGNYGWAGFDEILYGSATISIPKSDISTLYEGDVSISITTAIDPAGSPYSLYAKIDGVISPILESVITIEGEAPPEEPVFSNVEIISYDSPVTVGGTCRVGVRFTYQGPAVSETLYAAIGNYGWAGFDEILYGTRPVSVPASPTPTLYEGDGSISITTAIDPAGSPYSLYAKIGGIISPIRENVITVTEVPTGYILTIDISPSGAGTVTKSPDKAEYSPGEQVTLGASAKSGYEFDHWAGAASGTSKTAWVIMDADKLVVAVFREVAPPETISFSVSIYSIPSWLQPVYRWYIIWRGETHGRWTDVSYPITLEDVKATGAMTVVLELATGTQSFTTVTYTLEDGRTYKFNVEYLRLE